MSIQSINSSIGILLIFIFSLLTSSNIQAQQFEHPYSNRAVNQTGQATQVGKGPSKKGTSRREKRKSKNYKSYSGKSVSPNPSASTYSASKSSSRAGVDRNAKFKSGKSWINTKSFGEDPSGKFLFTPEQRGLNVRGVNRNDRFKTGKTWINTKSFGEDPSGRFLFSAEERGLNMRGVNRNDRFKTGKTWINTKSFGEDPSGKFLFSAEERGLNMRGVNPNDRFKIGKTWINEKRLGINPKDKRFSSYGDYTGDISMKAFKKSKDFRKKDLYDYSGDISMKAYKKSKDFKSKDRYDYSGDLSVRVIKKQERKIKAKGKLMDGLGNQQVTIVSKGKNMHPSIAAQGSKVRTQEQTHRYRNRQRLLNRWFKNRELPPAERKEPKKPTYDSREAAIWN